MQIAIDLFCFFGSILLPMIFFFTTFAALTFGRKFDRLFKNKPAGLLDPQWPILSKFFYRPFSYMASITAGQKYSNKPKFQLFYGNYNFQAHSTKFEKIFSWIFINILCYGCLVSAIIFTILTVIAKLI